MNYSDSPSHVRVDRFKPGGKWYDTFMVDMIGQYDNPKGPYEALTMALKFSDKSSISSMGYRIVNQPGDNSWFIVCLDPYHQNGYPLVLWLT